MKHEGKFKGLKQEEERGRGKTGGEIRNSEFRIFQQSFPRS
jgi:hypothetical protein